MIVLDEQLLGRNLERNIAQWYRGNVCVITDLRPGMVIKDDVIPRLLRRQKQPTFVTINETDFWRKIAIDRKFCVVCYSLPDSRAIEIADSLRSLFRLPEFRTKAKRMGTVIRVIQAEAAYYSLTDARIRRLHL